MKRYLLSLILVLFLASSAWAGVDLIIPVVTGGGLVGPSCTEVVSDTFTGTNGTSPSGWTANGTWSIQSNAYQIASAGWSINNTPVGGTSQYAKVTISTLAWHRDQGLVFRSTSTAGTGNRYYVVYTDDPEIVMWKLKDDSGTYAVDASSQSWAQTFVSGDVLAAHITGTGASTVLKVWKNPTGSCPADWGTPGYTFTDVPVSGSTYADTGQYVGLTLAWDYAGVPVEFDNFASGTTP